MLHAVLVQAFDLTAEEDLRDAVAAHVSALQHSAGRGDREQVAKVEENVSSDPTVAFAFDSDGYANLTASTSTWSAGRFEIPSIGELRSRAAAASQGASAGQTRLWVLDGASPFTDIGALQATTGGRPLFQVASQFNCLEAPSPYIVPVAEYFHDFTQGPRASISAFPATLLRHYAAPAGDGTRYVQQNGGRQIDLLADVFEPGKSPVRSGYLHGHGDMGADAMLAALEANFDKIRVGVHDAATVALGYDWDGAVEGDRRIAQVFTSTVAAGGYGGSGSLGQAFHPVCRQLLRAAYLGTMLAALALRRSPVVLTLIGGGVFGNPVNVIWESILWAFDSIQAMTPGMDIVVNGRDLVNRISILTALEGVRPRRGAVIRMSSSGLAGIDR